VILSKKKRFCPKKGIDLGDDKVKNWLVSLTISTLFGFFVTLPIQVKNKDCSFSQRSLKYFA